MSQTAICAFCERSYEIEPTRRSVLCIPCQEANQERVRRMGYIDEIRTHVLKAIQAIERMRQEYPDAAGLVEQADKALVGVYPGLDILRSHLHAKDRELDQKLDAAHMARH